MPCGIVPRAAIARTVNNMLLVVEGKMEKEVKH